MTASIIILNFNGKDILTNCLRSLAKQTFKDFEIILVDNGSSDFSAGEVLKNFPQAKIITNKKNLGFAAGNNQGYVISVGKYIVTLNNDTEVVADWLEKLIAAAEKEEKIGMCASKILSIFNRRQIDSVGVNVCLDGMSRGRGRGEIDNGQYDNDKEILLPSACAALYRRKMIEEIGFFDEDFFAYCEDTDLGLRGRLAGWEAVLVPTAVVFHRYSATGGKYSSFKAFLVERNHCWVVLKNFPLELILLFPFLTFWRFFLQMISIVLKKGATTELISQISLASSLKIVLKAYYETLGSWKKLMVKKGKVKIKTELSSRQFSILLNKHRLSFSELVFKK